MDNYTILIPSYTVGPDSYKQIKKYCSPYGKTAVVIGGEKAMKAASDKIKASTDGSGISILGFLLYGQDSTYEAAKVLEEKQIVKDADMIFAVGGGKAVDTAKLVSIALDKPFFTFPTIASNCAAASSLSIVYNTDGSFREFVHFLDSAKHVFIDTDIIARSPGQYLFAGIGDTYAKYYEVSVSARGEELSHYLESGILLSRMCMETLIRHGEKALQENNMNIAGPALTDCALSIIISTGWVSMLVSRDHNMDYNGGAAHAMFYSLCRLPGFEENHIHGIVVALGVLLLLYVDGQDEEAEKLKDFNKRIGLPTSLADIGISTDELMSVSEYIIEDEDLLHYPYRLDKEMIRRAAEKL